MLGYIFGLVLYSAIGVVWSYVVGFRFSREEDFRYILLCTLSWPITILLLVAWTIEDTINNLSNRRR